MDNEKWLDNIVDSATSDWCRTQAVQNCQSIEELEMCFDNLKEIKGTKRVSFVENKPLEVTKTYTAEKMKAKILQLRQFISLGIPFENIPWNLMTRTHGIRAKCMELFYYEIFKS